MESICPCCATHIEKLTPEIREANNGATLDCPNCEALLIIKDNRLYEFHSHLNKETEGQWPVDGKNTGSIELS